MYFYYVLGTRYKINMAAVQVHVKPLVIHFWEGMKQYLFAYALDSTFWGETLCSRSQKLVHAKKNFVNPTPPHPNWMALRSGVSRSPRERERERVRERIKAPCLERVHVIPGTISQIWSKRREKRNLNNCLFSKFPHLCTSFSKKKISCFCFCFVRY